MAARLKAMGVHVGRIGIIRMEARDRRIRDYELAGVAKVLGLSVARLLGR
jgi:hypothetical protein